MLESLEDTAFEYGRRLNNTKTELLSSPRAHHTALRFRNGVRGPNVSTAKYLRTMTCWTHPFETAFYHRLGLAEEACKKLRFLVKEGTTQKIRRHFYQCTRNLTPKQLHRIDGQDFRFLRRARGIKASFYSRRIVKFGRKPGNQRCLPRPCHTPNTNFS